MEQKDGETIIDLYFVVVFGIAINLLFDGGIAVTEIPD
jgi:hypothetical protein